MKASVEKQKINGIADVVSLAVTTCGVGYIPGAPGTYGSAVGVGIYLIVTSLEAFAGGQRTASIVGNYSIAEFHWVLNAILLAALILTGMWAAGRSIPLLGNEDPAKAVIDEVMGQLLTFAFVPVTIGWPFLLAGFLLFRVFDIWKPYPARQMEALRGGLGICADDLVAGVYAGLVLSVGYAVYLMM